MPDREPHDKAGPPGRPRRVVAVGCGNIGSHLVGYLARMLPDGSEVLLIDKDSYDESNLRTQAITALDFGKPKTQVQARSMRKIRPAVAVRAVVKPVEDVPLGLLRADVILACVDSRAVRQYLNQAAWRLGTPLIDAGVRADGLLARVDIYMPGSGRACMACQWTDADYATMEQRYPCLGGAISSAATHAPASLGALAASIQAIECQKYLTAKGAPDAPSRQIAIDARHHHLYATTFHRREACRADHDIWTLRPLGQQSERLTLQQVFDIDRCEYDHGPRALWVQDVPFVARLTCTACGWQHLLLRLRSALRRRDLECERCGGTMAASAFDYLDRLDGATATPRVSESSLRRLGIRPGEVVAVGSPSGVRRYVIGDDRA